MAFFDRFSATFCCSTAVPAVIPTLSAWGRWLLMALLAMVGGLGAQRRLA
jgi:hypothetical protein